jgi:hypothetical protein
MRSIGQDVVILKIETNLVSRGMDAGAAGSRTVGKIVFR